MTIYSSQEIEGMDKRFRANLINSISGFKSANLIGTTSQEGVFNLAVFSSVVHIGSNPPLIGFFLRPIHVVRNTYNNLLANGKFTINALPAKFKLEGHKTSAKYSPQTSEFDKTTFEYIENSFGLPYVKQSPLAYTCELRSDKLIELNDTRLIIGEVIDIRIGDVTISDDGFLDLSTAGIAAISGADSYHEVLPGTRFTYARPDQEVRTITNNEG
jgi:flavin reductase (DIM6/NTAB) family NADH-FMN oxidoreductase RutF